MTAQSNFHGCARGRRRCLLALSALAAALASGCVPAATPSPAPTRTPSPRANPSPTVPIGVTISLPPPRLQGAVSLEEALARRRSLRSFSDQRLTLAELGQLLWAAQGITSPAGLRAAPSAGALYPLEIYAVTPEGVYHYRPQGHQAILHLAGDVRSALAAAALSQAAVAQAAAVIVIAAVYARTAQKYGATRTPRYVALEAGHVGQNVLLQAVALGLGGVPVGAFYDDQVQAVLKLPADQEPLYLIPIGHPA